MSDHEWDYVVVGVDVEREPGEEIGRDELRSELGDAIAEGGVPVEAVRPWAWADLAGEPERRTRMPDGTFAFVLEGGLAFVLVAGAGGVIGNRADAAVTALMRRVGRRLGRTTKPLDRDTALLRAQTAVAMTWPQDVDAYHLSRLHVEREELGHDGAWEFEFVHRTIIGTDGAGGWRYRTSEWVYGARVLPRPGPEAVATAVRRRRGERG